MASRPRAPKAAAIAPPAASNVVGLRAGDTLTNLVTGMGAVTSKRGGDLYTFTERDMPELMNMYRGDWMSGKAVDIIAEDMTKEWRKWQLKPNQITAVDRVETTLGLGDSLKQAIAWGRMLGGGALILSDGNSTETPLTVETLQKGALKYSVAMPRTMLQWTNSDLDWNPASERYRQPEFWELSRNKAAARTPGSVDVRGRIHWTRVFLFFGNHYPDPMAVNDPWSDSILQRLYSALADAATSLSAGAATMEESNVDVIQMENLENSLSSDPSNNRLMERLRLFALSKSMFKLAVMSGKETLERKQLALANVDRVLMTYLQVASGATDIPATRFLAQSPAGMNSTGESDLRNYAALIRAKQNSQRKTMRRMDELLLKSALGNVPKSWWYEWRSIWTPSPKEEAEINKINAEADALYANSGLIPTMALEAAVQARLIDSGLYPGLEEAIAKLTAEELEQKRPDPAAPALDPNKDPANFPEPEPDATSTGED